jgi:hypothetical protein
MVLATKKHDGSILVGSSNKLNNVFSKSQLNDDAEE